MMTLLPKLLRKRFIPSCQEVNTFLNDYLDARLDPKTQKRFKRHMALCPQCQGYLEQYQTTIALLKEQPAPNPPAELVEHTLRFLKKNL